MDGADRRDFSAYGGGLDAPIKGLYQKLSHFIDLCWHSAASRFVAVGYELQHVCLICPQGVRSVGTLEVIN